MELDNERDHSSTGEGAGATVGTRQPRSSGRSAATDIGLPPVDARRLRRQRWASRVAGAYSRVYAAVNTRLCTVAGGRLAGYCRPQAIALLLTERCNARCVHCNIWQNRGKEDPPTFEQWTTLLNDLRRWLGPVSLIFTGGEALLVPFAPDLVAHAVGLGLRVEHLTHGYWLDPTRIERLARANPWKITISFDGVGETHSLIRGRPGFFDVTAGTIETLKRLRREHRLGYLIRLKTVIMEHNLDDLVALARFADQDGMEICYQPIEQNYNSADDPRWFEHSTNWPREPERAVAAIRQLIAMKRQGSTIVNRVDQLEAMIAYFRDPAASRVLIQDHAEGDRPPCAALGMLQVQANGDVTTCAAMPPVGNIKRTPVRQVWERRPKWWISGCCRDWRMSDAEKAHVGLSCTDCGSP